MKTGVPMLLKVLSYDQNFESRGVGSFVIVVASEPAQAEARARLLDALNDSGVADVKKRPIKYVAADYKDDGQFQQVIDRSRPGAVLVVPGASEATVKSLWELAQDNQLYALALEAATVELCFPIGVSLAGEKPQIVINEKSAKAVGVRFETSVLRLARVIQ